MLGFCSNPDCNTQVMDLAKKGEGRFLTNYRDHWIELSNGTIMRVGVCVNCKAKLVSGSNVRKTAEKILQKHKAYWTTDPYAPKDFQSMEIVSPNTSEKGFMEKRMREEETEKTQLDEQKENFKKNHSVEMKKIEKEEKEREKKNLLEQQEWGAFDPESLPDTAGKS